MSQPRLVIRAVIAPTAATSLKRVIDIVTGMARNLPKFMLNMMMQVEPPPQIAQLNTRRNFMHEKNEIMELPNAFIIHKPTQQ